MLLTWLARNNDPFDQASNADAKIDGPTLTLLFDPDSPFRGHIDDVVVFYREARAEQGQESAIVDALQAEITRRRSAIRVHRERWRGDDPTDYTAILAFLRDRIGPLRERYAGRELVIHISPGTPAMQTVWVLMAECGMIAPPFEVVKSYRARERRGRPPVVPVQLGIETFYKAWQASRPSASGVEQAVSWDPARFRGATLRGVYEQARRLARLRVPVLILGERGTGKTTLASWIRSASPFRREVLDKQWPTVACGQFTGDTIRSELLGHKKGAFTGADAEHPGLLKRADGDTLFLDEVADLSPAVQRLLIRALEEQSFVPLGSDKTDKSVFRLVTATNRPLDALRERLDPDFFDRISAFRVTMPPLRAIPEELDWLWPSAFAAARDRAGLAGHEARLDESTHAAIIERLRRHRLPGNVRDLLAVAWHVQAALLDEGALAPARAGALASAVLDELHPAAPPPERGVARAWADDGELDALAPAGERFPAKQAVRELQRWLAGALRALAERRRIALDEVSDITGKTLRDWEKPG
ncbi:MAG: sigma 54-interacting transcriptional regulator [bacterium]